MLLPALCELLRRGLLVAARQDGQLQPVARGQCGGAEGVETRDQVSNAHARDHDHDADDQAELCVLLGVGPQHGLRVDDRSQSTLL